MDINLERDVCPFLKDKSQVEAIMTAQRNALVLDTRGSGYLCIDQQTGTTVRLRGLTTVLDELFWCNAPPPAAARTRRVAKKKMWRGSHKKAMKIAVPAPLVHGSIQERVRGQIRGSLIHRQLEDAVTLTHDSFWRRNPGGAHPWVPSCIHAIGAIHCIPIASEFSVFSQELRLATSIDCIAVRRVTGVLNFIELKTGYEGGAWTASSGFMRGSLSGLRDSPKNRAFVQIVAGACLAVVGHGLGKSFACTVIHVNGEDTAAWEVPASHVQKYAPLIWNDLAKSLKKKK